MASSSSLPLASFCLALSLLSGCVTEQVDTNPSVVATGEGADEVAAIPLTPQGGLLMAKVVEISSPVEMVINKKTGQRLRLIGVAAPNSVTHPGTYAVAMAHLQEFAGKESIVYIRMARNLRGDEDVIEGELLLRDASGQGFLSQVEAMLSRGLLRIVDRNLFATQAIAERMRDRERDARRQRLGIWADSGAIGS